MPNDLDIPFDRVTYRDGQLLAAQDLRDDHRHALRGDALHTRYLHDTWWIALGFEVSRLSDGRKIGVGPGHAIDELGRAILLAKGVEIPVPDVRGPERFALTLRYQEDSAFPDRRDVAAVCLCGGLGPRSERPAFSWRRPGEVRFGIEVPLASVSVSNSQMSDDDPDLRVRHTTRPLVRPYIGKGETEAGRTGWQYDDDPASSDFGLSVNVDTSAAGFTRTPFYFAQLLGEFSRTNNCPELVPFGCGTSVPLGGLVYMTQASESGFTLRIRPRRTGVEAEEAERRQWRVVWIGLEPMGGCQPIFYWSDLYLFVAGFVTGSPRG